MLKNTHRKHQKHHILINIVSSPRASDSTRHRFPKRFSLKQEANCPTEGYECRKLGIIMRKERYITEK